MFSCLSLSDKRQRPTFDSYCGSFFCSLLTGNRYVGAGQCSVFATTNDYICGLLFFIFSNLILSLVLIHRSSSFYYIVSLLLLELLLHLHRALQLLLRVTPSFTMSTVILLRATKLLCQCNSSQNSSFSSPLSGDLLPAIHSNASIL